MLIDKRLQSGLASLSDPIRRSILELLRDQPRSAGAIATRFPVSWPAVSRHLRVLKQAGLI
jgi:DNA-binding transcriptional ArsR family regulator